METEHVANEDAPNEGFSSPFGLGPGIDLEQLALDMERDNARLEEEARAWKPPIVTLLFDMVELQQLEERLESAVESGHVMAFDE